MIIAIIGPDGCGKTSVALELRDKLISLGRPAKHYEMRYGLLPELKQLLKLDFSSTEKSHQSEVEYLSGMKVKKNSLLRTITYMSWYTLDYVLGQFVYRKDEQVKIFSRYFSDYLYQIAYRDHAEKIYWLYNVFVKIPDLTIVIKRDPLKIYSVKPELTVDEIHHQYDLCICKVSKYNPVMVLQSAEDIAVDVEQIVRLIRG